MDLAAAGLLYGLGATLALAHLRRLGDLRWTALGLLAGCLLLLPLPLTPARPPLLQILPAQGALLLSLGMGLLLRRQPRQEILMTMAGFLSAAWASMLLPLWPEPVAMGLPLATMIATLVLNLRSAAFSTPLLRQDAAVLLLALGLAIGLIPDIQSGWASASALQASDGVPQTQQQYAQGALLLSAASLILGLIYTRWRYR